MEVGEISSERGEGEEGEEEEEEEEKVFAVECASMMYGGSRETRGVTDVPVMRKE